MQMTFVINPVVGCLYSLPGPWLPYHANNSVLTSKWLTWGAPAVNVTSCVLAFLSKGNAFAVLLGCIVCTLRHDAQHWVTALSRRLQQEPGTLCLLMSGMRQLRSPSVKNWKLCCLGSVSLWIDSQTCLVFPLNSCGQILWLFFSLRNVTLTL